MPALKTATEESFTWEDAWNMRGNRWASVWLRRRSRGGDEVRERAKAQTS